MSIITTKSNSIIYGCFVWSMTSVELRQRSRWTRGFVSSAIVNDLREMRTIWIVKRVRKKNRITDSSIYQIFFLRKIEYSTVHIWAVEEWWIIYIYNNESIQNDNSILKHFACIIHQQWHKFRDYNVISIFIISTWFMSVTWATFIWSNEHRKTLYHCAVRHASKKPNVALQSTIIWEYPRIEIWY